VGVSVGRTAPLLDSEDQVAPVPASRKTRVVRGCSHEADHVKTLIERSGVPQPMSRLRMMSCRAYLAEALAELEGLGLVLVEREQRETGKPGVEMVRLTALGVATVLMPSWSRVS
jgi:hypothetical protein